MEIERFDEIDRNLAFVKGTLGLVYNAHNYCIEYTDELDGDGVCRVLLEAINKVNKIEEMIDDISKKSKSQQRKEERHGNEKVKIKV